MGWDNVDVALCSNLVSFSGLESQLWLYVYVIDILQASAVTGYTPRQLFN